MSLEEVKQPLRGERLCEMRNLGRSKKKRQLVIGGKTSISEISTETREEGKLENRRDIIKERKPDRRGENIV